MQPGSVLGSAPNLTAIFVLAEENLWDCNLRAAPHSDAAFVFTLLLCVLFFFFIARVLDLWQHQQHPESVQREGQRGGGSER